MSSNIYLDSPYIFHFSSLLEIPWIFQYSPQHWSKWTQLLEPHWGSSMATDAEEPKDKEGRERRRHKSRFPSPCPWALSHDHRGSMVAGARPFVPPSAHSWPAGAGALNNFTKLSCTWMFSHEFELTTQIHLWQAWKMAARQGWRLRFLQARGHQEPQAPSIELG